MKHPLLLLLIAASCCWAQPEYLSDTQSEYAIRKIDYDLPPPPPPKPPRLHLLVDKSDYMLYVYEDDNKIHEHRVVVGRADSPTPTIVSTIGTIVINPEWYVPEPLLSNLIKIIQSQSDPIGYMRRRKFVPYNDEGDISLEDIAWNDLSLSGPYPFSIRQSAGPDNFIGKVLMIIEDTAYAQLHDTPDKEMFDAAVREFSAGCIRVENIEELTERILDHPIDEMIKSGRTTALRILDPVEIDIRD
jgi:murein L,D-transpeptidase YcbB/YkuD